MTNPTYRLSLRRILGNLFVALVGAYGLSVTGYLLLRQAVGEQFWLVALFNNTFHLLLIPAVLLIPLCVLLRRVRVIALLIVPLLAFLLSYALFFLPRAASAMEDVQHLRVLTYNLKFQSSDLEPVLNIIRDADADVVALQELTEEAAAIIHEEFAEIYPHMALHPVPGEPIPGQGLLSRYPITSEEYWRIHLGHQRAVLDVDGDPITFYNTHPVHPFVRDGVRLRGEEITEVLNRASADTSPLIIAGDFNMTDQTADYWRVASQFHDAYREVGWGMGFTFHDFTARAAVPGEFAALWGIIKPLARIDYVFYNESFTAVDARVWPESGGSDHRPVVVELVLKTD